MWRITLIIKWAFSSRLAAGSGVEAVAEEREVRPGRPCTAQQGAAVVQPRFSVQEGERTVAGSAAEVDGAMPAIFQCPQLTLTSSLLTNLQHFVSQPAYPPRHRSVFWPQIGKAVCGINTQI